MFEPKQISVSCERVINLGNYESVRFRASVEGTVLENDVEHVFMKAWEIVEE